jgi:ketosteroid isomerase-like protein
MEASIKRVLIAALAVFFSLGSMGVSAARGSRATEKAMIEKTIRDSICWALTKDTALRDSTMAQDKDLFYFGPGSMDTVDGWDQHVKQFATWMDPRFKAVRTEVRDLRVHLSRSGDVAWFSAFLDDVVEWDGKRFGGEDQRWTGVLEKRAGKWLIVQMHFSLASDKVAAQVKAKMEAAKNGKE